MCYLKRRAAALCVTNRVSLVKGIHLSHNRDTYFLTLMNLGRWVGVGVCYYQLCFIYAFRSVFNILIVLNKAI